VPINIESPWSDVEIERQYRKCSDKSELFDYHWKYKISLHFWQVAKLLYWFPKPESIKSSAPYRYESLLCLIVYRFIFYDLFWISEKIINSISDIWELVSILWNSLIILPRKIHWWRENHTKYHKRNEISDISPSHKKHDKWYRYNNHDGTKIRLWTYEKYKSRKYQYKRKKSVWKRMKFCFVSFEEVRKIDNQCKLEKFCWLYGKRYSRNRYPSSSTIEARSYQ